MQLEYKFGALRFSRWMAPTLSSGRIPELLTFVLLQEKRSSILSGIPGLGVVRVSASALGLVSVRRSNLRRT